MAPKTNIDGKNSKFCHIKDESLLTIPGSRRRSGDLCLSLPKSGGQTLVSAESSFLSISFRFRRQGNLASYCRAYTCEGSIVDQ